MKDGIIIQARSGSGRLPGKVLLPFYKGDGILEIILHRIIAAYPDIPVIVATTALPGDDVVEAVAIRAGVTVFRGAEQDVLARFTSAAEQYGITRLIRVCADNPFLQVESFRELFDIHTHTPVDYLSWQMASGRPVILSHLGLFPELVTSQALQRVAALTDNPHYCEHVTNYIYTHPDIIEAGFCRRGIDYGLRWRGSPNPCHIGLHSRHGIGIPRQQRIPRQQKGQTNFRVKFLQLPAYLGGREDLRFTLDTQEDFTLLQEIYQYWMENGEPELPELIRWIDTQSHYRKQMKQMIATNQK